MTGRGLALLLGGVASGVSGWFAGWPELTAIGAGALALVLGAVLVTGRTPRMKVSLDHPQVQVVRGQEARALVTLRNVRAPRGLRLVVGSVRRPSSTVAVPRGSADEPLVLAVPLDTSVRGEHAHGPYLVVKGDPWSIVTRTAGRTQAGTVLVCPRTHPVRRRLSPGLRVGESDASTRVRGDDHFYALREYVLGDEPRSVHWRSSARAGHLVVRQQVRAASDGTTVILDSDLSAYSSDEAFSSRFLPARFELAVEVAASLCASRTGEQVHLLTTVRGASVVTAAASVPQPLIDALALVTAHAPVEVASEELPGLVRRTRCSRLLLVTGDPSLQLVAAARTASKSVPTTLVVRVGGRGGDLPGLRCLDIDSAEDLA